VLGVFVAIAMAGCLASETADRPVIRADSDSVAKRADVVQAAKVLRDALVAAKVYPRIERRCLAFDFEGVAAGSYDFAVRFNQPFCSGSSASNLIDRYRIDLARSTVLLYDPAPADGVWYKPLGRAPVSPVSQPSSELATRVLVEKSARRLTLVRGERVLRTYTVALGSDPVGPKGRQGDGRTPEGTYVIDGRKETSGYHRSLHVSYPTPAQRAVARSRGIDPGGEIFIHGLKNGLGWLGTAHRYVDWTQGCIAVTNAEIEEIWHLVPDGTPIEIRR
jgi:lipoprotein-anchoring transpeptidase ErfK/SrfK